MTAYRQACARTLNVNSPGGLHYWNQTQRKWCHLRGSKGTLSFRGESASSSSKGQWTAYWWWFQSQWRHCFGKPVTWAGQSWSQLGERFRVDHAVIWSKSPDLYPVKEGAWFWQNIKFIYCAKSNNDEWPLAITYCIKSIIIVTMKKIIIMSLREKTKPGRVETCWANLNSHLLYYCNAGGRVQINLTTCWGNEWAPK